MSWLNRKRPDEAQGNQAVAESQTIELKIHCSPSDAEKAQESLQKLLGLIGLEEIRRLSVLMDDPEKKRIAINSLYKNT